MRDRGTGWFLACSIILMAQGSAEAQWSMDAGFGRSSHEAVASRSDGDNAVVGLRYSGAQWIEAAVGAPLGSSGRAWASLATGVEWSKPGKPELGVSGNGQAYTFGRDRAVSAEAGWGSALEVTPFLRVRSRLLGLVVRSGPLVMFGESTLDDEPRVIHTSWVVIDHEPSFGTRLEAFGRHVRVDGEGYATLGGTAAHDAAWGGAWARAGQWISTSIREPEWSVGAYVNAGSRLQIYGSVHHDPEDPVYRAEAKRTWTLGASLALSRRASFVDGPPPFEVAGAQVVIRIPRGTVVPPSIAGDFTGWRPMPMAVEGEFWVVRFTLEPGLYRFSFQDAEGAWFLPPSVTHRVPDDFGGENGLLVVQ